MLLELFKLRKLPIISNASRNVYKFIRKLPYTYNIKKLSYKKKNNAGRSSTGNLIIFTKSSLLHKKINTKVNYNLRYNKLGFISSFKFLPFKNKILMLILYANGAMSYYVSSENHKLFSYLYVNKFKNFNKFIKFSSFRMLSKIKKLSFVNSIELLPGRESQYCRSSGAKGKIIKFDYVNFTSLIELPSGLKKIFSLFSFASPGKVSLSDKRDYCNGRAGYWKNFGKKSIVRGVAMNAVDHPHGGRTKTIRYPMTPWGKTTKFK